MTVLPAYDREPFLTRLTTYVRESGWDGKRPFVVLEDTILYPEGGGQPSDRGSVGGQAVLDVQRVAGAIRHYLAAPVAAGPVEVRLDWERRFEHMQQHTAQHLLTALAQDRFGWPTTAFHLGDTVSDVELDTPGLSLPEREALEEAVAQAIRAALPVAVHHVEPEQLEKLQVRTRGLPEGFSGPVRLVEIAGVDLNTCGGTHLASTAQIEGVKLLDTEPMRGGVRLRFVAGVRLRRLLGEHEARAAALRNVLGASDDELAKTAALKLEQLKDALRRVRALEEELALSAAEALATRPGPAAAAHWPARDGAFLQRVAREFTARAPGKLALLTAGEADDGLFLLTAGPDVAVDWPDLARRVAETLGGRGGGAGRLYQGKATRLSARGDAAALLEAAVTR